MRRLIFQNLRHKPARTLLTICGLAIASGALFLLLAFQRGYERGLQHELAQLGAHVLVVPKGCPYDAASLALHGANWPCYLKEEYLAQVAGTPGVAVAAPALMAASYGAKREIVVGITPEYLHLRPTWKIKGSFPEDADGALLGAEAARAFNAVIGQEIHFASLNRLMRVSGILHPTAGSDDDFIFIPLQEAQRALNQQSHLTHILVKLADAQKLEQTVEALRGCEAGMQMNIVPLAHLFDTIRKITSAARNLLGGLAIVAFIVAATALANTMLMAVFERTREIGVMRAIGASTRQIGCLFLVETLALGATGAATGLAISLALGRTVERWVRNQIAYAPDVSLIGLDWFALGITIGFALTISLLVGIPPALRAARLSPVEAFRAQASY